MRMPEGMRDRLARAARENARSINSEIVAMLEAGLAREDRLLDTVESIKATVDELRAMLAEK